MTTALRVGMGNTYGLTLSEAATDTFDPEAPSGVMFKVTKPSGALVSWTATIVSQSPTVAVADYRFDVDGEDLDEDGTWRVWIQWTGVSGETPGPRSEVTSFDVIAADQL